jgi:thiol-disulfide isomerase/thioredoxin
MKVRVSIVVCFTLWRVMAVQAQSLEEDFASFRLTPYDGEERFMFEGVETLAGEPFDGSALTGGYALVNIWATWCPYCARERSSLERFQEVSAGVCALLTISVQEPARTVSEYMAGGGYTFAVALDPTGVIRRRYAPGIPTTYILDGAGVILARIDGHKTWDSEPALSLLSYFIPGLGT